MGELVDQVDKRDQVLGVVERGAAMRHRLLHRIATTVCRDADGRFLVHRRADTHPRFPGQFDWMLGGAVHTGESYEKAAARELTEELGVVARPRFVLKFLCEGALSPYWLGLHEVVVRGPVHPDPAEISWHTWLPPTELSALAAQDSFVPDAREALTRYRALNTPSASPSEARDHRK
ncbi:NUDIX hydrolase [Streptomyces sp. NPDC048179]|uniref:NUDIX hydrolase n=1 Tax=Streptomyces sp. NPDC048179 TaxID=3365506 RepID=UPI003714B43E